MNRESNKSFLRDLLTPGNIISLLAVTFALFFSICNYCENDNQNDKINLLNQRSKSNEFSTKIDNM